MKLNNLTTRVISGLALIFLTYCYIYLANENVFAVISAALAVIAGYEFSGALTQKGIPVKLPGTCLLITLFLFSFWALWKGFNQVALISGLLTIAATLCLSFGSAGKREPFFWRCLLLVWILSPLVLLFWLRFGGCCRSPSDLILFLIIIVGANDTFAYFGGKKFGKHPLAPVVSPNKTIEGSLSGLAAGVAIGFAFNKFRPLFIPGAELLAALVIIILCSQAGDLLESKFKRYCQVKDSGGVIPGHGGILDRIDSYLLAIPVFTCVIHTLNIRL